MSNSLLSRNLPHCDLVGRIFARRAALRPLDVGQSRVHDTSELAWLPDPNRVIAACLSEMRDFPGDFSCADPIAFIRLRRFTHHLSDFAFFSFRWLRCHRVAFRVSGETGNGSLRSVGYIMAQAPGNAIVKSAGSDGS
jgi:hypothetical protein